MGAGTQAVRRPFTRAGLKTAALTSAVPWDEIERVIILSPHLDDAALSCGGLLNFLIGRKAACLVISIYCGTPAPVKNGDGTLRNALRKGHVSPRLRRREDVAAMHSANADFVHLGFLDGIYRRSPLTNQFIYRHAREKWVAPRIDDLAHVEELYLVLRRHCLHLGRILLVSPMGIGQHVDHTIVARVAVRLAEQGVSVLFFEDFPYVVNQKVGQGSQDNPLQALGRLGQETVSRLVLPVNVNAKADVIRHYHSQIPALFNDDQGLMAALQASQHAGLPSEFYWKAQTPRPN
ncbi:MAG: LmbE family N-acetylglucosaminyl deacetylase [Rhodoferax sp.]|jgi:LmbE family N-acetylglucosaminyl deacetylase